RKFAVGSDGIEIGVDSMLDTFLSGFGDDVRRFTDRRPTFLQSILSRPDRVQMAAVLAAILSALYAIFMAVRDFLLPAPEVSSSSTSAVAVRTTRSDGPDPD
ncbi:MAG: hypothetical protein KC560_00310, partial [Myxococcales bacterium]|nr:hypothetical protein [Myxococcales bacterium]